MKATLLTLVSKYGGMRGKLGAQARKASLGIPKGVDYKTGGILLGMRGTGEKTLCASFRSPRSQEAENAKRASGEMPWECQSSPAHFQPAHSSGWSQRAQECSFSPCPLLGILNSRGWSTAKGRCPPTHTHPPPASNNSTRLRKRKGKERKQHLPFHGSVNL